MENKETLKDVKEEVKTHKEQMKEFAEFIKNNNVKKKGDAEDDR